MKKVEIKEWFVIKNYEEGQSYSIRESGCEFVVEGETEKALKGYFDTNFGKIYGWVPKSVIVTEEDKKELGKRIYEGQKRYERIIAWCKEQGLKVRNMMKMETIKEMVKKAGLEIPENI